MADWTELDTNTLLPGEPLTSAKTLTFFENPIAMAEGKVNAPKVVSEALNMLVGVGSGTTSFTNLGRIDKVLLDGTAIWSSGAGSGFVQYRTSTDNGATYGAYTNIPGTLVEVGTPTAMAQLLLSLGASINAIGFRRNVVGVSSGAIDLTILGVSGVSP